MVAESNDSKYIGSFAGHHHHFSNNEFATPHCISNLYPSTATTYVRAGGGVPPTTVMAILKLPPDSARTADIVARFNESAQPGVKDIQDLYGYDDKIGNGDEDRFGMARRTLYNLAYPQLQPFSNNGHMPKLNGQSREAFRTVAQEFWDMVEFRPKYRRDPNTPKPHWVDGRLFPDDDARGEEQGKGSCFYGFLKFVWRHGLYGRNVQNKIKSEDGAKSDGGKSAPKRARKPSRDSTGRNTRQKLNELRIDGDPVMPEELPRPYIDEMTISLLSVKMKGDVADCEILEFVRQAVIDSETLSCSLGMLRTIYPQLANMQIFPVRPDGTYGKVVRADAAFHSAMNELYRTLTPQLSKMNFVAAAEPRLAWSLPGWCRLSSTYMPPYNDNEFEFNLKEGVPVWARTADEGGPMDIDRDGDGSDKNEIMLDVEHEELQAQVLELEDKLERATAEWTTSEQTVEEFRAELDQERQNALAGVEHQMAGEEQEVREKELSQLRSDVERSKRQTNMLRVVIKDAGFTVEELKRKAEEKNARDAKEREEAERVAATEAHEALAADVAAGGVAAGDTSVPHLTETRAVTPPLPSDPTKLEDQRRADEEHAKKDRAHDEGKWPHMIRAAWTKDSGRFLPKGKKVPSMNLPGTDFDLQSDLSDLNEAPSEIKMRSVKSAVVLSNDDDTGKEDMRSSEDVVNSILLEQLDPEFYQTCCRFFGFDPDEIRPTAMVSVDGIKEPLYIWQAFAGLYLLRQMARGHSTVWLALEVGFGKTVTSFMIVVLQGKWRSRYTAFFHDVEDGPLAGRAPGLGFHDQAPDYRIDEVMGKEVPRVTKGATLFVMESILLHGFCEQLTKFVETASTFVCFIDKASKKDSCISRIPPRYFPKNTFHVTENVFKGDAAMPPEQQLRDFLPKARWARYQKQGWLSMKDLLDCKFSDTSHSQDEEWSTFAPAVAAPWHGNWLIVGSTGTMESACWRRDPQMRADADGEESKTLSGTTFKDTPLHYQTLPTPGQEVTMWKPIRLKLKLALVVLDESQKEASVDGRRMRCIGSFMGNPSLLCMSATPFRIPEDYAGAIMATHSRWFNVFTTRTEYEKTKRPPRARKFIPQNIPGTAVKYTDCAPYAAKGPREKTPKARGGRDDVIKPGVYFKDGIPEYQREFIGKQSWNNVEVAAKAGRAFCSGDDYSTITRDNATAASEYTPAQLEAMAQLSEYMKAKQIAFSNTTKWGFDGDKHMPIPMMVKPASSAFIVEFQFEDDATEVVAADLKRRLEAAQASGKSAKEAKASFFTLADWADKYTILPEFWMWATKDDELKKLLEQNTAVDSLENLRGTIFETEYMEKFHHTPLAKLLLEYMKRMKDAKNYYKKFGGKKAIFTAFKPFVMFTIGLVGIQLLAANVTLANTYTVPRMANGSGCRGPWLLR